MVLLLILTISGKFCDFGDCYGLMTLVVDVILVLVVPLVVLVVFVFNSMIWCCR